MSMRIRGTFTRAPPPPSASSRRAAGCWNEPSRCLNFCHALRVYERSIGSWKVFAVMDTEYERCTLRLLPVRFVSLVPFSSRRSLSPPSLPPIKGRSLLPERRTRTTPSLAIGFTSELLLSSSSRLAACTARRDSRPPRPHFLSHVREKGDKVFGERSA